MRSLSLAEVADRLAVSIQTVRSLISRGQLHAYRVGRQIRVDPDCLDQFTVATAVRPLPADTRPKLAGRSRNHMRAIAALLDLGV